jgi:hypothetical protein
MDTTFILSTRILGETENGTIAKDSKDLGVGDTSKGDDVRTILIWTKRRRHCRLRRRQWMACFVSFYCSLTLDCYIV